MRIIKIKKRSLWKVLALLLILFVAAASFLVFTRPGKATAKTIRFIKGAFPTARNLPQTLEDIAPPETVYYEDDARTTEALLFRVRNTGKKPAIIISWGVGLTEENLRLLYQTADLLSKLDIAVLIPFPESLKRDIVTTEGIKSYVHAFQFLEKRNDIDAKKIGFMGFCAGGSFVILAASDEQIKEKVAFVQAFAPYNSLTDYYVQGFTNKAIRDGDARVWPTNPITREILIKNFLERLENEKDKKNLTEIYFGQNQNADSSNQALLSNQGKMALEIINSSDPLMAKNLIGLLPQHIQNDLTDLSPNPTALNIKGPLFIVHDLEDTFTPVEESERLAEFLGKKANLARVESFNHTILDEKIPPLRFIKDLFKVGLQLYKIFYIIS